MDISVKLSDWVTVKKRNTAFEELGWTCISYVDMFAADVPGGFLLDLIGFSPVHDYDVSVVQKWLERNSWVIVKVEPHRSVGGSAVEACRIYRWGISSSLVYSLDDPLVWVKRAES